VSRQALLAEAPFRAWYLSRTISFAGTAASTVAMPLLAYQLTGNAAVTATVAALEALPYLLLGLFAGAAADRLRRKAMMVGADLWCALATASVPVAWAFGVLTPAHILLASFVVGLGFCWFDAAAWGALVRVAGKARLAAASSIIMSTQTVLLITVPAAAGLAASLADPAVVVAADAVTYLASAALLAGLRADLDPARGGPRRIGHEIAEGLRYLWRQPIVRTLSLTGFALSMSTGGAMSLLVVQAHESLGLSVPDKRLGLLYTAGAVGSLAAAWYFPRLRKAAGPGRASIIGYAIVTAGLAGIALNTSFAVALALWLAWDFAATLATTNGILIRQELTPDELQGRVNTTGRMIAWGGTPFGAVIGGLLAEAYGTRTAYLALLVPVAAGLTVLLLSPVRRLRTLPPVAHPAPEPAPTIP
jgi:MFS family permease